ncbi:MAG: isopenicillin N synthase family oxygenase [Rhodospirillaceae bacterium]|jgi:isopenicillin N synthase-like dioxygenase|nr:isopenicillin N synthase family oxygenase [Rhodospirillaceae bacterium]MBT4044314.1 isopenicillin N synthase family oxygenase [Rhodospirillaceae bacterium]MBT4688588.1 isopenicillin N synthase family oxygenase [Rhodospirillaceae bacterium]MBT5079083.1 isopenicillin N synthase family oxygenase [Rhodospirillaceae bacterium]MBT5526176.1 isopenicillin N synthase family oxygenase [Rhodospirillaceae bacterium]
MSDIHAVPPRAKNVPVIDMAPLLQNGDAADLVQEIRTACEQVGFFYVKNHGIPAATITAAIDASRRFFEQPLETRMKTVKDQFHRGYLPIGTTRYPGQSPDLKDSFDISVDLPLDDPDVISGLPLHGPNQWPDLADFREPAEEYFSAVQGFGMRLLEALALSLELAPDFFTRHYKKPTILMRLMHYPPQDQALDEGSIGATPHADFGLATVLYQDPSGGLELQLPDGSWISAPFIADTLVVNLGQLMARWTNDVYRAALHRVVNRRSQDRYSIPFFFNPDHHAPVECIASCQSPERPALYPPVNAGDYITQLVQKNQDYQPNSGTDSRS